MRTPVLSLFAGLLVAIVAPGCGEPETDRDDGTTNDGGAGPVGQGSGTAGMGGGDGGSDGGGNEGGAPQGKRTGLVQLDDHSLLDDQGRFNALGATMMWAAWGYKFDRERLEQNLAFLSDHGFHYVRALGVVGNYVEDDFWEGREIDWHWEDYDDVIAGLTDLAYDQYGLRIEWTLIGDGQLAIPNTEDRYALADRFLAMSVGREQKIMHFEIANEAWQNGFGGDEGIAELRDLSLYMKERTDILVAASAPDGPECERVQAIYAGEIADIATIHFDRNISLVDNNWRPVRQPWEHEYCEGVPVGSNNEPIGPGASVSSENEPVRLVAGAITTYVSNLPFYVFHSKAGVRGDENLWEMAGADAFVHVSGIVPPDLASWERKNAHWTDAPFVAFAGENNQLYPDTMWPDLGAPESGAVRVYGDVDGDRFFVFPIGILGHVTLAARRPMEFDVIDPMTGEVIAQHTLAEGESFDLSGGEALVLSGTYL